MNQDLQQQVVNEDSTMLGSLSSNTKTNKGVPVHAQAQSNYVTQEMLLSTVKALVDFFDNKISNLDARNLTVNRADSPRASSSTEIVQRI